MPASYKEEVGYDGNFAFLGHPRWYAVVTVMDVDGKYYGSSTDQDEEEEVRRLLPQLRQAAYRERDKAKTAIKPLEGEAYWKMLEETAKRVDTWPEWKKG